MADCNTCNQYMSVEDILRRSIKCDANGNVAMQGGVLNVLPQQLTIIPNSIINPFDTTTGMTFSKCTAEINTVEKVDSVASIKLTTTSVDTFAQLTFAGPFNLLNNARDVKLRFFPHSDVTKISAITIIASNTDGSYFYVAYYPNNPWVQSDWTMLGGEPWKVGTGTPSWAAISSITIRITKIANEVIVASLDVLDYNVNKKKAILIEFDDANDTDYTVAYPLLKAKRMVATSYVITSYINAPNHLTSAMLTELNNNGWDIGNHTHTHLQPPFTKEEYITELENARVVLDGLGLTRASKHVGYAGIGWTAISEEGVRDWGALTARDGAPQHNFYEIGWPYTHFNCYPPAYNEAIATTKAFIDNALLVGATPVLVFHKLVETPAQYEYSIANFIEIINYIESLGLQTLTTNEYYRLYSGAISVNHK